MTPVETPRQSHQTLTPSLSWSTGRGGFSRATHSEIWQIQPVCPYLLVADAAKQIEFLQKAFNGQPDYCARLPDGSIMHAQVRIGDSVVMLGQIRPPMQPMPAMVHLYVADADATFAAAVSAGATVVQPVADQFYGDRSGGVSDSNGNIWWISTHVRDVSEAEMAKHMESMQK
jgi:PhnB protein